MLPEVVGHVSLYLHRAQTPEKKQQTSVTMCTVSNNIENSRLNAYICPHSFTPLASKTQIPPRCGRDYTKETDICRQHSAARHSNGGKPEDAPQQYRDVTTIRQTRHFRSRRRQISRWRRLWSKQTGGGGRRFLPLLLRSFNVSLALAYFTIRYTHIGLQLCYGTTASATFGYFLCTMQVNVRGV